MKNLVLGNMKRLIVILLQLRFINRIFTILAVLMFIATTTLLATSCRRDDLVLANLSIQPHTVDIGQQVNIRVDVRNLYSAERGFRILLWINGREREVRELSIPRRDVEVCNFQVTESIADTYRVTVYYVRPSGEIDLSDEMDLSGEYIVISTGTPDASVPSSPATPVPPATPDTSVPSTPATPVPPATPDTSVPSTPATPVPPTVTIPSITGQWQWNLTVTVATGACEGEEGPKPTRNVQITQNEKTVTMSGFLGKNPSTSISGVITFDNVANKWIVMFSGSWSEDQGTTTSDYTLTLNNTFDEMTGDENWNWVGGEGSCPGSKSFVSMKKLP